jgi:NAD(P)-dependent dehydrogenase (short-subunit alcohol dehydrogenase family)
MTLGWHFEGRGGLPCCLPSRKSTTQKQRLAALGRLRQPQDIADVVALICSDDARWITGQNVRANGGTI